MIHGCKRSSQHGFAMLEIFMALGVGMAALAAFAMYQSHINATREAQAAGRDWSQIGSAMRAWVGLNAGRFVTNPPAGGAIDYTDLNFLRNASCGGTAPAGEDFLPCHVANYGNSRSSFYEDPQINTTIIVVPPANPSDVARIEVRATQLISGGSTQNTAGKIAAIIAQSAKQDILGPVDPNTGAPTQGAFISYWANAPIDADPNTPAPSFGADTGRVVMALSNGPSHEAWLRVDGANMMLANLNMGDGSHDLVNARNIEANGIGIFGEGVIADGDISTTKNLYVGAGVAGDGDTVGMIFADDMLINDVSIGGANPLVSHGIYDARIVTTGTSIDKPVCVAGSTPQIIATPVSYASDDVAQAIHSVNTYATDSGATWTVNMDILTSDGWIPSTNPNLRLISVLTKCS